MSRPTVFGAELNRIPPQSVTYNPLKPSEQHGRVRIAYFTLAVAAQAQNAVIGLCNIPKHARVLNGVLMKSATAGATVNWDLGLAGNDNNGFIDDTPGATVADSAATAWFGNVANTTAESNQSFAQLPSTKRGYTLTKDCILVLTVKGAPVTAPATLTGYVEYVLD
jgi:hypothetical protein